MTQRATKWGSIFSRIASRVASSVHGALHNPALVWRADFHQKSSVDVLPRCSGEFSAQQIVGPVSEMLS